MHTMYPVADARLVADIGDRLRRKHAKYAIMWAIGIDTGLRISDILDLTGRIKPYGAIPVVERKTGKTRVVRLSRAVADRVRRYMQYYHIGPADHIIPGCNGRGRCSRSQAWRVIRAAAKAAGSTDPVGTHGMRKTYALRKFLATRDVAKVQADLMHQYLGTTVAYIAGDLRRALAGGVLHGDA